MTLTNKILRLIEERKNVSFAELARMVDGFSGDKEVSLNGEGYSNIILWSGISDEAIDALMSLTANGKIHPVPAHILVYLADGAVLKLPIARTRRHYKKPHWIPTVYNPGPEPKRKRR